MLEFLGDLSYDIKMNASEKRNCIEKAERLILFGGISPEHEVSLRSAESVLNNIDHDKYNIFPVGITKEGDWVLFGGRDYSSFLPALGRAARATAGRRCRRSTARAC